jgi:hypothetical protein
MRLGPAGTNILRPHPNLGQCRQVRHTAKSTGAKTRWHWRSPMNSIIYIVGLVVIVAAILTFFGLR